MKNSRGFILRGLAVVASAALVFAGTTTVVAAAVGGTPVTSAPVVTNAVAPSPTCTGASAFKSITYKVTGVEVPDLSHHVKSGSTVSVSFQLVDACNSASVGIASYKAVSGHGNAEPFSLQTLSQHDDGMFSPGVENIVSVVVPNCFFQVDFYTGSVNQPGTSYSTAGRLVSTDVGGTTACNNSSGGTTTSTSSDVAASGSSTTCPATMRARVTNYAVTVGGVAIRNLSAAKPGDTVVVHFTVAAGCTEVLSLASYQAKSTDTSPAGVLSQTLYKSDTGTFKPGDHTMTVKLPDCYYQVDFVEGKVIEKFGPVGTNNYYAGHILDTAVGGTAVCADVSPTTILNTATTANRTNTTSTTSPGVTAAPGAVGPAVLAETQAAQLATTGFDVVPVLCLGMLLVGFGAYCLQTSRRLRYDR